MLIGYARVSTADQNPDHQIDALLRAGVDRAHIHLDTAGGAKASRPQLDLVLQVLREGDTLKVTRLDRLSRSVLHLVTLGAELRERGIGLHVIEQGIDTATAEGRAMFGMLSVLAELQRELIVANTNDGLAAARARGRVGGRRPRLTPDQAALAQQLYDARDKTVQQIADLFGVPRSTVYGHLDRQKTAPRQPKKTRPDHAAPRDQSPQPVTNNGAAAATAPQPEPEPEVVEAGPVQTPLPEFGEGYELWRRPGSGRHVLALQGEPIGYAEHAGLSTQWKAFTPAGAVITLGASRRGTYATRKKALVQIVLEHKAALQHRRGR